MSDSHGHKVNVGDVFELVEDKHSEIWIFLDLIDPDTQRALILNEFRTGEVRLSNDAHDPNFLLPCWMWKKIC